MNTHVAYICCHELPRPSPGEEWGMQSLLFYQDNAACFPSIRHEILCPLCLFTFTMPIIKFEIATLATNDMWPYSPLSMSGLAGLRAAAFIFTFTLSHRIEMRWMSRDLFLGHSRSMICYASNKHFILLPKIIGRNCMKCIKTHVSIQWYAFRCSSDIRQICKFRWSASALSDHQKFSDSCFQLE